MFNDINSIRSDSLFPISHRAHDPKKPGFHFNYEKMSQSQLRNYGNRWKSFLLP